MNDLNATANLLITDIVYTWISWMPLFLIFTILAQLTGPSVFKWLGEMIFPVHVKPEKKAKKNDVKETKKSEWKNPLAGVKIKW